MKACKDLDERVPLFDTTDLFEEKNPPLVLANLMGLGRALKTKGWYHGALPRQPSSQLDLWSAALIDKEVPNTETPPSPALSRTASQVRAVHSLTII